jgi:hypothetical protein
VPRAVALGEAQGVGVRLALAPSPVDAEGKGEAGGVVLGSAALGVEEGERGGERVGVEKGEWGGWRRAGRGRGAGR